MKVFNFTLQGRNPLLTGLVVFVLTVALTQSLSYQRHLISEDEMRSELLREANAVKDRLNAAMTYNLSAVKTLGFIVEKYGVPENFDEVAKRILESNKNIDALELTKAGVITHIYPLKGNENVIGYDVFDDPVRSPEAIKAIKNNELFFAGPLVLKQGGVAIIGRLPIYRNYEFEGFSVAIVKLSTLIKAVGINTAQNDKFSYQLSKKNPRTLKEEFFLNPSVPFTSERSVSVEIPDGGWKLYVTPRENTVYFDVVAFSILGLIFSILCGAFAFYLARQPDKFKKLVAEKTTEIINEKNLSESILNSLPGIFYLYDKNGKFMRWNKNFELISGYAQEEIRHMHPLDFFDADERDMLKNQIDKVFEHGMAEVEAYFLTKNKIKIPYYFNGHIAKLDGKDYLIGVGIDIADRNRAQKELKESETRLNYAQEVAKIGSWETNLTDLSVIWSNQTFEIFEIDSSAMDTSHLNFLQFVHPEDKEKVDAAFGLSFSSTDVHHIEHRIITPGGSIKHLEERWRIVHDTNNKPVRAVGTCQDITERKKIETALKESRDNIRLLNTHLQTIREEERTFIAREIHDELGQQLTGLKMDASWLTKKADKQDKAQQQKLADMIALIDATVKTVRRISSDLRPGILDDLGLIAALEWQSSEFEKRTGIHCSFTSNVNDLPLEKNLVTGIFRIYQETLTNAMRHAKATLIKGRLEQTATHLILSIEDDGVGFEIKEEKSNKTLGIIGMKERALMLGGELNIESELKKGTVVVLKIPCNFISS